jgi:hypothetical protein
MFPNHEQIGVIVSPEEAAVISDAHLTANEYLNFENIPDALRGGSFVFPEALPDGTIPLNEDLVMKAEAAAKLAKRASQRNWEIKKRDYITMLDNGEEDLLEFVQDDIREQQAKMIAFNGILSTITTTLELSQQLKAVDA